MLSFTAVISDELSYCLPRWKAALLTLLRLLTKKNQQRTRTEHNDLDKMLIRQGCVHRQLLEALERYMLQIKAGYFFKLTRH